MPIPILAEILYNGPSSIPYLPFLLRLAPWLAVVYFLKSYFSGAVSKSERVMHGKVIMITGGTSGIGASVAASLASRGAQLVLLTQHAPSDPFLASYVDDLRARTHNELIYAEQVDLSSLHSIRLFATKWIDNSPPRRLDMVILCAATLTPRFSSASQRRSLLTRDGLEPCWGVNYLANFHLLGILSPALRAQPADRDVRVVFATCASYLGGESRGMKDSKSPLPEGKEYGTSKLALMVFAQAFQRHLDAYARPDKAPNNARAVLVDPGWVRTPGLWRWLSMGSLWGLLAYLLCWPFWWLVLKSPEMGAQGFLTACMEEGLGRGGGGRFLKECKERECARGEIIRDEKIAQELWRFSERQIVALEREGAIRRTAAKKKEEEEEQEAADKKKKRDEDGSRAGAGDAHARSEQGTPTTANAEKAPKSRRSRKAG